jgi:hypothetical protein
LQPEGGRLEFHLLADKSFMVVQGRQRGLQMGDAVNSEVGQKGVLPVSSPNPGGKKYY